MCHAYRLCRQFFVVVVLSLAAACSSTLSPAAIPEGEPSAGIAFVSTRDGNEEIYVVQADGSGLTRLTDDPAVDSEPAWAPDGRKLAYRSRSDGSSDIFVITPHGRAAINLLRDPGDSFDDEFNPHWHPEGTRIAIYTDRPPFGTCSPHVLAEMTLTGGSAGIRKSPASSESFTWLPDGSAVLFTSACYGGDMRFLTWEPSSDAVRPYPVEIPLPFVAHPDFSPDGARLAFQATTDGNSDIYVLELETGALTRLTHHPAKDTHPTWSPDGSQLAFTTNRDGNDEIYILSRDGTAPRNLTNHPSRDAWPDWSPVKWP